MGVIDTPEMRHIRYILRTGSIDGAPNNLFHKRVNSEIFHVFFTDDQPLGLAASRNPTLYHYTGRSSVHQKQYTEHTQTSTL